MTQQITQSTNQLINYTLHLADSALILAQRNSEWCGHGPILEQDIAITNISLDLLGQSRNFYQYAAEIINQQKDPSSLERAVDEVTEDSLAYFRTEREFKNLLITELPKGDWAQTITRQFFMSVYYSLLYTELKQSTDKQLSAIAAKSLKEIEYHVKWSKEWVIRLGEGSEESNSRMKLAIQNLWPYSGELFMAADFEIENIKAGIAPDIKSFRELWMGQVIEVFNEAGLDIPEKVFMQSGGKTGSHTENLGYVLAEMQYLQRTYPGVEW